MLSTYRLRNTTAAALSILLFSMAGAMVAQEPLPQPPKQAGSIGALGERQFDLGWNEILLGEDIIGSDPLEVRPVRGVRQEAVMADALLAQRDRWRTMAADEAFAQQTSQQGGKKKGGFGRWLKKRWYVSVAAAILLGIELSDDDNGMDDD